MQVFAAVFLELTFFEPAALPAIFPAIEHPERVQAVLARDVDCPALLARTRPRRCAGAVRGCRRGQGCPRRSRYSRGLQLDEPAIEPAERPSKLQRLAAEARKAAERGNSVRAAILWTWLAHRKGPGEDQGPAGRGPRRSQGPDGSLAEGLVCTEG